MPRHEFRVVVESGFDPAGIRTLIEELLAEGRYEALEVEHVATVTPGRCPDCERLGLYEAEERTAHRGLGVIGGFTDLRLT